MPSEWLDSPAAGDDELGAAASEASDPESAPLDISADGGLGDGSPQFSLGEAVAEVYSLLSQQGLGVTRVVASGRTLAVTLLDGEIEFFV